tara:strand:+ start:7 stop:246 length:240 start_codon:yes stop_codon:yes gene_type:complete
MFYFSFFLASHPVDELASPAKVTQVITCLSGIIGEGQHTLDSVIIHIGNAIKGIGKHRIAMSLRDRLADKTKGGNNKVI